MNTLPTALPLTPDACQDAASRSLTLEISADTMAVLVSPADAATPHIYAAIALDAGHARHAAAVEEAVYSNPMLLCDFRSVKVLLRGGNTLPAPRGFGRWPAAAAGEETLSEGIPALGIELTGSHDSELMKFLRRSFNNPTIGSHMAQLCSFCGRLSRRANRCRAYVQYLGPSVDVLLFDKGRLLLAATYAVTSPDDALYYVLAACATAGFSRSDDELMLVAPSARREELQPLLRKYVNYVMPLILPAELCREAPLELALAARPNNETT